MSLIEHADGRVLDHIGWGVPDVASGVETLAARTGVDTIQQPPPDSSLPFSNAVLRLTNGSKFVEVIGPNPEAAGDHSGSQRCSMFETANNKTICHGEHPCPLRIGSLISGDFDEVLRYGLPSTSRYVRAGLGSQRGVHAT